MFLLKISACNDTPQNIYNLRVFNILKFKPTLSQLNVLNPFPNTPFPN